MAVSTLATGLLRRAVAGEPWLIRLPDDHFEGIADTLRHLPQWQETVSPFELRIDRGAALATSPGTVQQRGPGWVRQVYAGISLHYSAEELRARICIPEQRVGHSEVLARLIMLRAIDRGLVPVHAAAIGTPQGFWLIPGSGGSGKSTAAAVAAASGMRVLGDDLILWDPASGTLFSVSGLVRLTRQSLRSAPAWPLITTRPDGKAVLLLPRGRLRDRGRLAGLLLIGPTAPPATPQAALRALASSVFQLSRIGAGGTATAAHLGELARQSPIRSLAWTPDPARWADRLAVACAS